jgi:hypothetical protein
MSPFMGSIPKAPKLFTCPKCRKAYLGHDPLPDCPVCGFDYRVRGGFRWDVLVYLLSILGLMSYLLVSSSYRSMLTGTVSRGAPPSHGEKLPGAGYPTGEDREHHESGR